MNKFFIIMFFSFLGWVLSGNVIGQNESITFMDNISIIHIILPIGVFFVLSFAYHKFFSDSPAGDQGW